MDYDNPPTVPTTTGRSHKILVRQPASRFQGRGGQGDAAGRGPAAGGVCRPQALGSRPGVPAQKSRGRRRRARPAQVAAHEEQLCTVASFQRSPRLREVSVSCPRARRRARTRWNARAKKGRATAGLPDALLLAGGVGRKGTGSLGAQLSSAGQAPAPGGQGRCRPVIPRPRERLWLSSAHSRREFRGRRRPPVFPSWSPPRKGSCSGPDRPGAAQIPPGGAAARGSGAGGPQEGTRWAQMPDARVAAPTRVLPRYPSWLRLPSLGK